MFTRLFMYLFISLSFAILLAVVLFDSLYVEGIKSDEITNTRGIKEIVVDDLLTHKDIKSRLNYWSQRFNYQLSIQTITKIKLEKSTIDKLITTGVFVDAVSGWPVDDISLYYYIDNCNCVLVRKKNYGSHGYFQTYWKSLLVIIILVLSLFIFIYVHGHKQQVKKLGCGSFETTHG